MFNYENFEDKLCYEDSKDKHPNVGFMYSFLSFPSFGYI